MIKRGKDTGRADDNPDTIRERLKVYHRQTQPLRDFYIKEGSYHAINGHGELDRIFSDIKDQLDKIEK